MDMNYYKRVIEPVFVTVFVLLGATGLVQVIDGQQRELREITRIQITPIRSVERADQAPIWTGSTIELAGMNYLVALESLNPSQTLSLSVLVPDTERNRDLLAYLKQDRDSDAYRFDLTYVGVDATFYAHSDSDNIWLITNTETKQIVFQSNQSQFPPYAERGVSFLRWRDDQTLIFSTGEGDAAWSSEGFVLFDISKNEVIGGLNRYCVNEDCTFKPIGVENSPALMVTIDSATLLTRESIEIDVSDISIDYQYPIDVDNNLYYFDQGIELRNQETAETFFVRWDVGIAEIQSITVVGQSYLIAQEIVSAGGRVARMLTVDTSENREHLQRILDLGFEVSNTWFPLDLTIWSKQGELVIHELASNSPVAGSDMHSMSLKRWDDEQTLVFTSALGDAGISAGQTYLYSPDAQILTPTIGFFMDGGIFNGQATSMSHFFASNEGKHLVQFSDAKTGGWTPVYWLTREEIGQLQSLDDLNDHLHMVNTNKPLEVDISSKTNTRRYKEGIEIVIDGTTRFVPWDSVLEVDGPSPANP